MRLSQRAAPVLVLVAVGCSAGGELDEYGYDPYDDEATEAEYTHRVAFDRHRVLEDEELGDWQAMSTAEVQSFLEQTPYGWRSVLADHQTNGISAAESITFAAQQHAVNPLVILTRTQLEQSLIGKKTASQTALDWAMGCGCPDNQPCNSAYKGFDKQIACMASKFRGYLDAIAAQGKTVSGWGPGIAKTSLDGYSVTPENAATASIYTYTPWVSAAEKHVKIWSLYASHVGYVPPSAQPAPEPPEPAPEGPIDIVVDTDNALNGESANFAASTSWTGASSAAGYYGSGYLYRSTGASSDMARFEVHLAEPAAVTVEAWWTSGSNRSKSAPFLIYNAGGDHVGTAYADQQDDGGAWVHIGSYQLTAGWNAVALSRWTTAGYVVIADAVRVRAQ